MMQNVPKLASHSLAQNAGGLLYPLPHRKGLSNDEESERGGGGVDGWMGYVCPTYAQNM